MTTRQSVPFTDQAKFTIASYPFSMKVNIVFLSSYALFLAPRVAQEMAFIYICPSCLSVQSKAALNLYLSV